MAIFNSYVCLSEGILFIYEQPNNPREIKTENMYAWFVISTRPSCFWMG